jgi:hypothetical protein
MTGAALSVPDEFGADVWDRPPQKKRKKEKENECTGLQTILGLKRRRSVSNGQRKIQENHLKLKLNLILWMRCLQSGVTARFVLQ